MKESINALQQMIDGSGYIVFFGGAGVSTESGVPDFRSVDGLYSQKYDYPPETMLSHDFFFEHTGEFYGFYRDKLLADGIKPNPAHLKLAELERAGRLRAVVTQNIDGLHTDAGSREVLELHGSVRRNHCLKCGRFYGESYIRGTKGVPRCECGGIIKPDVVLYGEALDDETVSRSIAHIRRADMLIIGGTSLAVYPAASLIDYFRGRNLVIINRSPTPVDFEAGLLIKGSIGEVFSQILAEKRE